MPHTTIEHLVETLPLTKHALQRMSGRRINRRAVAVVLCFGRSVHVRGAEIRVLGRNEIARTARLGLDFSSHEGIHVVCSTDGSILTVYRNRSLHGLRPRPRHSHPTRRRAR